MKIVTIVGNPKPLSKTYHFAKETSAELKIMLQALTIDPIEEAVLDLADYGTGLVQWNSDVIAELLTEVADANYIIVASPTYKATYTGLLKLFLDILPMNGLEGKLTFPIMIGGGYQHQLACEVHLKPLLAELGATTAKQGLYVLDSQLDDCKSIINNWLGSNESVVKAFL